VPTETAYADLFRGHPFQEKGHAASLLNRILADNKIAGLFNFDN
jgi:hypothetical protein